MNSKSKNTNHRIPKFNNGECGEDCNCMKIEIIKNGWDSKTFRCLEIEEDQKK